MNNNPLVSIYIPTFNRANLIWRALESCVNQTYRNIEIIVSDNASTDDTQGVVLSYANRDKRIKYFRNEVNIGSGNNYLKCAEHATGHFVQALGDDNWLSRNYIEKCVENLFTNPDAAAILTNLIIFELQEDNSLRFTGENIIPSGRYSTDWFFKNVHSHPFLGSKGFFSMMRRNDFLISFKDEMMQEPIRLIKRRDVSEPIDGIIFWKILIKYKYFIMTNETAFIVMNHSFGNIGEQGVFEEQENGYVYYSLALRQAYDSFYDSSEKTKKYRKRMRFSMGLSIIVDTPLRLLKQRTGLMKWGKRFFAPLKIFFKEYSLGEKAILALAIVPYCLIRAAKSFTKVFFKKPLFLPSQNYFLTEEFKFKAKQ
ncbi:glycosyltransferase family 2 protein [bacterium]|nr:MAG: glycosyltransferase family 2 protein [bacterium]